MEYTDIGSVSYDGMEKKSTEVKYYVNPDNPEEGFSDVDNKSSNYLWIGGLVFALAGVGIFFLPTKEK